MSESKGIRDSFDEDEEKGHLSQLASAKSKVVSESNPPPSPQQSEPQTESKQSVASAESKDDDDSDACSVCLNEPRDPCLTNCRHTFCKECLKIFLEFKGSASQPCPLCRAPISLFTTAITTTALDGSSTTKFLSEPRVISPFGNSYIQNGLPGVASYHFVSIENCYISYRNSPSTWKLDNGSPLPETKQFENPDYNALTRTFTAEVTWVESSFLGYKWKYSFVFSVDFLIIETGSMKSFKRDGSPAHSYNFPRNLKYWIQKKSELEGSVFVQGDVGVASYHFNDDVNDAYISYSNAPQSWVTDDGAPLRGRKYFTSTHYDRFTQIFRGVIIWSEETISGNAKWKYEMIFSDDFNVIESGTVRSFGVDGELMDTKYFGVGKTLNYRRVDEGKVRMGEISGGGGRRWF